jgi:hypothetical protein
LGADNRNGLPGVLGVVALAVALAIAWNGIFYLSALSTRNHTAVLGLQPLFMPVVMFSTFWVPTSFMPGWYETIATWNPFTPTLDAARSILLGPTDWATSASASACSAPSPPPPPTAWPAATTPPRPARTDDFDAINHQQERTHTGAPRVRYDVTAAQ